MDAAQSVQPFDWYRMFLGEQVSALYLLEISFRTAVMYSYAIVFSRLIGKRGVGQISPFEFIIIIIVSSAAGDPMFYAHVPLLHGILVMTVIMFLHRLAGLVTDRSERAEDVMEGEPVLVIEQGFIVEGGVGPGTLSRRELLMKLRQQGIRDVGEVERAFFEPSGQLSVLQAPQEGQRATLSTMPRDYGPQS